MAELLPRTVHRELQFEHGRAIGISNRWEKGQYCSILTPAGIVGCGIYDLETPAEFGQAIAIAKGTPACPLVEPEDLFDARIVGLTPRAASFGSRAAGVPRQHRLRAEPPPGRLPSGVLRRPRRPRARTPFGAVNFGGRQLSTVPIRANDVSRLALVVSAS